ncbi:hypothetical protein OESDEN_01352 [Oesophagostomum dentatum]|uniref:CWH43-like N-terminal domain-containing protein n=1 Tax=Oesophagostomum dentatum TaxID=61180 RepID=A0A0B1TTE2_OESDE|nr:hypothetical protein OESDEN_01352 [Oesophagostomum dentatum]
MLQCGALGASHLPIIFGILFSINLGQNCYISSTAMNQAYFDVQETAVITVHLLAALLCFGSGCLYMIMQSWITVRMYPVYTNRRIGIIRSCIAAVSTVAFCVGMLQCGALGASHLPIIFGILFSINLGQNCYISSTAVNQAYFDVQETAVITVHLLAALLCFGSGCLYMIMQSWITVRMYPVYTNRRIGIIRSCIAAVSTVAFCVAVGFGFYAAHIFHLYYPDLPTPRPWNRKLWQPGYDYHVVSAIAEWVTAIMHVFFIVSYSRDFEKLRVSLYVESLVTHLDHSPILRSINDLTEY